MNELAETLNYLENEIVTYKTNLEKTQKISNIYTYKIPFSGSSNGSQLNKLNLKFKGGFSPFISVYATGTVDGKDISNPDNGGLGFRSVNYQGIGDYSNISNESYITLAVANPKPPNPKWNQWVDFNFMITVKSLTEIESLIIGPFTDG
jgi:hypothetical protein|nr:MAG TPA: hypothetical protein [Caudoviricetes sp.]